MSVSPQGSGFQKWRAPILALLSGFTPSNTLSRLTEPVLGPRFTLLVPNYSFSVWVKAKSRFVRGFPKP